MSAEKYMIQRMYPQVKNVQSVLLGKYEVETWYFSPYPDDYSKLDKVCKGVASRRRAFRDVNLIG